MNLLKRTLEVTVSDTTAMETELSAAVDVLKQRALAERGCGILITRHGAGNFTVTLSDDVPFGLTWEQHAT